jgi:hypothetical protein
LPFTPRADQPYMLGGLVLALATVAISSHVFGAPPENMRLS